MIPDIIFTGGAGAGKSTAARLLVERFPELGFQQISFAAPLKVMLATTTDRHRMQEFGTDIVRAYDPDAWVRLFLWHLDLRTQIRRLADGGTLPPPMPARAPGARGFTRYKPIRWCVDDARFPNEIIALKDEGWIRVEVRAPRWTRLERLHRNGKLQDASQLNHSSETALEGTEFDYVIFNDRDEGTLVDELTTMLGRIQ